MKFLDKKNFVARVAELRTKNQAYDHWNDSRWGYHAVASALAQASKPKTVLELGTMGVKICDYSDEMDYPIANFWPIESPRYLHNAKNLPWPISSNSYELFIALRVFHHLNPVQRECFNEAKRISKSMIITVPVRYSHTAASQVLTLEDFIDFNNGRSPSVILETEDEFLYYWIEQDLIS